MAKMYEKNYSTRRWPQHMFKPTGSHKVIQAKGNNKFLGSGGHHPLWDRKRLQNKFTANVIERIDKKTISGGRQRSQLARGIAMS
jgi:hypothetical protein